MPDLRQIGSHSANPVHPVQISGSRYFDNFYNRDTKEICGRTCSNWICIIMYAIVYLLFLSAYTMFILYISLTVIKEMVNFNTSTSDTLSLVYPIGGVGLTAIPTSETNVPLIWYKNGDKNDYQKYVQAIDKLFLDNNRNSELGPCGQYPYGYGENPCVIIKINKQFHWSGKPLQLNSTVTNIAPLEVRKRIKAKKKLLWLECSGYHSYDKEHIGSIKYYPDPPGVDPDLFPLQNNGISPLVAIQISNFTIGVSLAIECHLWHEDGPSSIDFVLYVAPNDSLVFSGQTNFNE